MGFGKSLALAFFQVSFDFFGKVRLVKNYEACKIKSMIGWVLAFRRRVLHKSGTLTKRASDGWGGCGFEKQFSGFGLFYISNSFLAHPPLTQAVGWQRLRAKPNTSLIRKVDFMFGSKIQNHFLAVAFFKVKFLVNIFFQQASFQVLGFLFIGFHFISKVSGGLCRVAKISVKVFKSSFGQLWF